MCCYFHWVTGLILLREAACKDLWDKSVASSTILAKLCSIIHLFGWTYIEIQEYYKRVCVNWPWICTQECKNQVSPLVWNSCGAHYPKQVHSPYRTAHPLRNPTQQTLLATEIPSCQWTRWVSSLSIHPREHMRNSFHYSISLNIHTLKYNSPCD